MPFVCNITSVWMKVKEKKEHLITTRVSVRKCTLFNTDMMGFLSIVIYIHIYIYNIYIHTCNQLMTLWKMLFFLRGSSSGKYVMNKRRLILILEFFNFSSWDIIMKKSKMTGLPNLKKFAVFISLPNI